MQFKLSIAQLAALTGLASTAVGIPALKNARAAAINPDTATLEDFSSFALAVATSRLDASSSCTADNIRVRKAWEDLSDEMKIDYTTAMNCLMTLPAQTPSSLAAGAKTRYDDFIVTHINQTNVIHATANFLAWHRWFVFAIEEELRNVCGYTGYVPYWDWTRTAKEGMANSALFDGSATSLSGDGEPTETESDLIIINQGTTSESILPAGTGGGCVTSGPFVNMTVNLGPDGLVLPGNVTDDSMFPYEYNPRCLKRSLTDYALTRYANETSIQTLLSQSQDIWEFEVVLQGPLGTSEIGAHGGGHFALGGDPGRDVYTSPGDPAFWSHHANVDRVWWQWQMLDPDVRSGNVATAINGPLTLWNQTEPYGNGTLTDLQNLGYAAAGVEIELGELLSTTDGIFCYVYE